MNKMKITDSIYLIDLMVFDLPTFTGSYIVAGGELAVIESGPAKAAPRIIEGIREFGFDPSDISYLILTHIHLDHGGGAGTLIKELPNARVVVHEKGSKHLVDPSKLINSSRRVFGDLIDEWYGEILPVEGDRMIPVRGGEIIDLGKGQRLHLIDSPGHATHHISIYSEKDKGLFTGDAAGVFLPDLGVVIPTTPPPEFNPGVNIETIRGFKDLDLDLLLFSHFGPVWEVDQSLNAGIEWLSKWEKTVSAMMSPDISIEAIAEKFRSDIKEIPGLDNMPKSFSQWIMDHHMLMCASGYLNYFKKKGL